MEHCSSNFDFLARRSRCLENANPLESSASTCPKVRTLCNSLRKLRTLCSFRRGCAQKCEPYAKFPQKCEPLAGACCASPPVTRTLCESSPKVRTLSSFWQDLAQLATLRQKCEPFRVFGNTASKTNLYKSPNPSQFSLMPTSVFATPLE